MNTFSTTSTTPNTTDPDVYIDRAVVDQLENLAYANMDRNPLAANRLLEEIDRAIVLNSSELSSDIVTIGSEVTFRDNATGNMRTAILTMPTDADISNHRISIMTPIGAALIGIRKGETIWWQTVDNEVRELTIHDVVTANNNSKTTNNSIPG